MYYMYTCIHIDSLKLSAATIVNKRLQTPIFMPGWGDAFKVKTLRNSLVTVGSATPAIFMSILLFILPQVVLQP